MTTPPPLHELLELRDRAEDYWSLGWWTSEGSVVVSELGPFRIHIYPKSGIEGPYTADATFHKGGHSKLGRVLCTAPYAELSDTLLELQMKILQHLELWTKWTCLRET